MSSLLLHLDHGESSLYWHAHPDVIALCVGLLLAYWFAVTRLRAEFSDAGRVKRWQAAMFVAGVAVIYAVSSSPVHEIAEDYLASVHMGQHLAYTMIAPPLLIAGTPAWLLRAPLRNARVLRVARLITLPLVCFAAFNAVQVLTHLPSTVDFALTHHWSHPLVHVALVASALLMWWPILSPLDELPKLSYPLQMAYLFVQSLIPSVLAAFLTFSRHAFYSYYETAPRLWGLTPIEDQQFAGFVMKMLGSLILWGFIGYAFYRWYQHDQAESRDPQWDEVREEVLRLGLPIERTPARGEFR
jgi:putative membrane protein